MEVASTSILHMQHPARRMDLSPKGMKLQKRSGLSFPSWATEEAISLTNQKSIMIVAQLLLQVQLQWLSLPLQPNHTLMRMLMAISLSLNSGQ